MVGKFQVGLQKEGEKQIQEGIVKINLEDIIRVAQEEVQIKSHMGENQIPGEIQIKKAVILEILVEREDRIR